LRGSAIYLNRASITEGQGKSRRDKSTSRIGGDMLQTGVQQRNLFKGGDGKKRGVLKKSK